MKLTRSCYVLALFAAVLAAVPLTHAQQQIEDGAEDEAVRSLRKRSNNYKVKITTDPSVACPDMTISARVWTQANKPVDTYVKFDLQGDGGRFRANKKTNSQGVASFDFTAHAKGLKEGQNLTCSVQVENPNLASGLQNVPCPDVPICKQGK